jgi:hypothetical protein
MGQPVPPPIPYTYWLLFEECSAKYIPGTKVKISGLKNKMCLNMKYKMRVKN